MKTLAVLMGMMLMVGASHADTPNIPKIERTTKASVVVTKVDVANRHLTVKNDAGEEYTVDVDPAVKNLAQVKAGDKIGLTYYQSVAASMSKPGDATEASGHIKTETAKEGARPGATAQTTTHIPVTIVSVDTEKNVVKFRGQDDLVRTTNVMSPEGKAFIKNLKAGDQVMLTYTESLAIAVEPTK